MKYASFGKMIILCADDVYDARILATCETEDIALSLAAKLNNEVILFENLKEWCRQLRTDGGTGNCIALEVERRFLKG